MKRTKFVSRCVHCGSYDFEVEYDADGEELHELCTCGECGQSWTRVYDFVEWRTDED